MRDDTRRFREAIVVHENADGRRCHYDNLVTELSDLAHRLTNRRPRSRKDRVHRRHHRLAQLLEELQKVVVVYAVRPSARDELGFLPRAVETELVLNIDYVRVR